MKIKEIVSFLVSVLVCLCAGFIGSIFTTPSIATWYAALNKPSFNPPNWIFGPVWTTLFILMGIAAYLVWREKNNKTALAIFGAQLILNVIWSFLFFTFHSPFLAFVEIIFLWLAILLTILSFRKISKAAAWLLVPYILWVSFAAFLNLTIWRINS